MTIEFADYLQTFGPGIIASVVAAIAIWVLRGVLLFLAKATLWLIRAIWYAVVGAIKWRIGWY